MVGPPRARCVIARSRLWSAVVGFWNARVTTPVATRIHQRRACRVKRVESSVWRLRRDGPTGDLPHCAVMVLQETSRILHRDLHRDLYRYAVSHAVGSWCRAPRHAPGAVGS